MEDKIALRNISPFLNPLSPCEIWLIFKGIPGFIFSTNSLVGSGDRSDKVRTYNFPQNRVTDHRISLSLNKLDKVIGGDLEEIIEALQVAENAEKMKEGLED